MVSVTRSAFYIFSVEFMADSQLQAVYVALRLQGVYAHHVPTRGKLRGQLHGVRPFNASNGQLWKRAE